MWTKIFISNDNKNNNAKAGHAEDARKMVATSHWQNATIPVTDVVEDKAVDTTEAVAEVSEDRKPPHHQGRMLPFTGPRGR